MRAKGYIVDPMRVRVLMRRLGFKAIYPQKRRIFSSPVHKRNPYLMKRVEIERPDRLWAAVIIYIRLAYGFIYMIAVMDCYRRHGFTNHFCRNDVKKSMDGRDLVYDNIFAESLWRMVK